MRKRRILIGLSLMKPISTIGDKNNLSRGGRRETRTGTFFTGGYGRHGSEGVNGYILLFSLIENTFIPGRSGF